MKINPDPHTGKSTVYELTFDCDDKCSLDSVLESGGGLTARRVDRAKRYCARLTGTVLGYREDRQEDCGLTSTLSEETDPQEEVLVISCQKDICTGNQAGHRSPVELAVIETELGFESAVREARELYPGMAQPLHAAGDAQDIASA